MIHNFLIIYAFVLEPDSVLMANKSLLVGFMAPIILNILVLIWSVSSYASVFFIRNFLNIDGAYYFPLFGFLIGVKDFLFRISQIFMLQDMAGLISKINRSSIGPLPSCYSPSL